MKEKSYILPGQRFDRLVAVEKDLSRGPFGRHNRTRWLCACDCGEKKSIVAHRLLGGGVRSCGCLAQEVLATLHQTHGCSRLKDGRRMTEYSIWKGIRNRCNNIKEPTFKHYGGRGIRLCPRWSSDFTNFLADMGPRPSPKHSVERKNTNGDYSPENCCWATAKDQQNNRRNNRVVSLNGKLLTVAEAAEQSSVAYATALKRLDRGWSAEDAFSLPASPLTLSRRSLFVSSPENSR